MIKTWLLDIRPLYEENRYREYYATLPVFRKEKADRLRFQKDRAQSAGAWILLEMIGINIKLQKKQHLISHIRVITCCVLLIWNVMRKLRWDVTLKLSGRRI